MPVSGFDLSNTVFSWPAGNVRFKIRPTLSEDQEIAIRDNEGGEHRATVGELIEMFKNAIASGEIIIEKG